MPKNSGEHCNRKKLEIEEIKKDIEFLKSLHPKECESRRKNDEQEKARLEQVRLKQELEKFQEDERIRIAKEKAAREEAERLAKEEADRLAKEEAERKAKEEADRLAKEEADRLSKEEADRLSKEESDRLAKEEAGKEKEEAPPKPEHKEQEEGSKPLPEPPVDAKICGTIEREYSEEVSETDTLYDEIETELKDVNPTDAEREKKIMELYGNIEFERILCDKCQEVQDEYVKKAKEEGIEMKYNYFSMSCKACQRARFNSFKRKKKAEKQLEKASDRNAENKSKIKHLDKKLELKEKLEMIDEDYKKSSNDRIIEDLEKIASGKSAKLNLNIYVKKN